MHFELDSHGFFWVAKVKLPSWAGYLDRSGAYGGPGKSVLSDGSVEVVFAPEARDNAPLSKDEISLAEWVLENEEVLAKAAIAAILDEYPKLQELYGYSDEEAAEYMPDISGIDDLKPLIGLYAINIHQIVKDGVPYAGYEFGCTWDDEHGLGVLMHGSRVVEVGGSDTARLLWMAKRDAESR